MASQAKGDAQPAPEAKEVNDQPGPFTAPTSWTGKLEAKYSELKEHAKKYPDVWGSYILVYGTLGSWLAYRFRTLRKVEDQVLAYQEKVRQQILAEHAAEAARARSAAATSKAKTAAATSKTDCSAAASKADKAPKDATPKPME